MSQREIQPHAVDVEIVTKAVAASFECPFCNYKHRVDIDWFVLDELWEGIERYECDECGKEFDLNGHIEREVPATRVRLLDSEMLFGGCRWGDALASGRKSSDDERTSRGGRQTSQSMPK